MRIAVVIFMLIVNSSLFSRNIAADDVDPWLPHIGLMAGLNTSVLQVKGGFGPSETSTPQWTAAFGMYFKSNVKNMYRFEAQAGFEVSGAGREIYYQRSTADFVRIFDRYRTIPVSLLLTRNFGWKETISFGIGFKSSFVLNYTTRHPGTMSQSGIILTPDVLKWYGSPVAQLSINLLYADVSLCGWYAVTPVIDQFDVVASPYGITLLVKARLFQLGGVNF
jgi:hypothetical protein